MLPALEASPSALIEAAAAVDDEESAIAWLLVEDGWRFDEAGRVEHTRRRVYQLRDERALSYFGTVQADWRPWFQDGPIVQARVISPSGQERLLAPKTMSEGPVNRDRQQLYTELRRLQGPLPDLQVGSVVEEVVLVRDREPLFVQGRSVTASLHHWNGAPRRVWVEAPADAGLTWTVRNADVEVVDTRGKEVHRIEISLDRSPQDDLRDLALPLDQVLTPRLRFALASRWQDVAASYAAVVDAAIAAGPVVAEVEQVRGAGSDPKARVEAAVRVARERVKPSGVDFHDESSRPRSPADTLARGSGAEKDIATLVVALLRGAGIEAHLALVLGRPDWDQDASFPALNATDRVIVWVGGEAPIWVDPLDMSTPVGAVPYALQGRTALRVKPGEAAPVQIPVAPATSARVRGTVKVSLPASGYARADVALETTGWPAEVWRSFLRDGDSERLSAWALDSARSFGLGKAAVTASVDRSSANGGDFVARFIATDTEGCSSTGASGRCAFGASLAADWWPEVMMVSGTDFNVEYGADTDLDPLADRAQPFVVPPQIADIGFVLDFHPIYTLHNVPEDRSLRLGDAELRVRWTVTGTSVTADVHLDTGDGHFTGEEARQIRSFFLDGALGPFELELHNPVVARVDAEPALALAKLDELIRERPAEAFPLAQRGVLRAALGFHELGLRDLEAAVALDPTDAYAAELLASTRSRDQHFRRLFAPFDRAGSIAAYERAIELTPHNAYLKRDFAQVLTTAENGFPNHNVGELERALDLYEEALAAGVDDFAPALLRLRLRLGQLDRVAEGLNETDQYVVAASIAAIAIREGVAAADAELMTYTAASRELLGPGASDYLVASGEYRLAQEFGALLLQRQPQNAVLLKRSMFGEIDDAAARGREARGVELAHTNLMHAMYSVPPDSELVAEAFLDAKLRDEMLGAIRQVQSRTDWEARSLFWRDIGELAVFQMRATSVSGSRRRGYTVDVAIDASTASELWYARQGREYVLLSGAGAPRGAAMVAAWHLDRGRPAVAQPWVERALSEARNERISGFLGPDPALVMFSGAAPNDAESMELAVAMLLAERRPEWAEPRLVAARSGLDAAGQAAVDRALLDIFLETRNLQAWADIMPRIEPAPTEAVGHCSLSVGSLIYIKELEAADAHLAGCKELLSASALARLSVERAIAEGDVAKAARLGNELVALGDPRPDDLNKAAWHALWTDDPGRAVVLARRSLQARPGHPGTLHTLACALALSGQHLEARQVFGTLSDTTLPGQLREDDVWVFRGLLAEHAGLWAYAREAYANISPDDHPTSSAALAAHRVAELDAAGRR